MTGEPGTGEVTPASRRTATAPQKRTEGQEGAKRPEERHYLTLADKIQVKPTTVTVEKARGLLGQYEKVNMMLAGTAPIQRKPGEDPEIIRTELTTRESTLKGVLNELGYWEQVRAIRLAHRGTAPDY